MDRLLQNIRLSIRSLYRAPGFTLTAILGALLANRLLGALLYGVTPTDVTTLTAVTGFLIGVAALASLIPARSTTRIDAVIALRAE
jgi:putative ABC transport system permease protein